VAVATGASAAPVAGSRALARFTCSPAEAPCVTRAEKSAVTSPPGGTVTSSQKTMRPATRTGTGVPSSVAEPVEVEKTLGQRVDDVERTGGPRSGCGR
jgi:hypothetical protein